MTADATDTATAAAAAGAPPPPPLTAVILTRDEERHVARAIGSLEGLGARVFVADSGSTDRTVEIARALGAEVRFHPWRTHAAQFNWALDQLPPGTGWVLRLDADEIVTPPLRREIAAALRTAPPGTAGMTVGRRMAFMGRPMRHGGLFPIRVVRLFRHGRGRCEPRWMDEHIRVDGPVMALRGELLDDNRNGLTWWTAKHNAYASREVIDILNAEHRFAPADRDAAGPGGGRAGAKRWIKERVYGRLPGGARAWLYFLYRYVLRLGLLDGREGAAFHVLQGLWYRYLVDAKLLEVRRHMRAHGTDAPEAIGAVLGIDVGEPPAAAAPSGPRP